MTSINLIIRYFLWHYTKAFVDFFHIWRDFFWFCLRFFSIPTMLRTLFSPWKRISEERSGGIEGFFTSLVVNSIMRIIGFFMRSMLIVIGCLSLVAVFVFGVTALVIWIFAPLIILVTFVKGIIMLFK